VTLSRLNEILDRMRSVRIGVCGDFCIDAYWQLDRGAPEISLETGKPTSAVRSQRYTPGGGGNVAANLTALGAGTVRAFSVIGHDMYGRELTSLLRERGIDTSGLLVQEQGWETPVYAKPYLAETEQERIDFGRWNALSPETESALCRLIRSAIGELGALIVNQQLAPGVHSGTMIRTLNECARDNPSVTFMVDARTMSDSFTGMVCKLNAREASRLAATAGGRDTGTSHAALRSHARAIGARCGKPVFVTRGAEGILVFDGKGFTDAPAVPVTGPVDTVGAGDATVSAIAATIAAGGTLAEAAEMGNLAAAVTVRKMRETGTATRGEILSLARERGSA
jgi:rfaE bifunctional protein kinase chain/domain